MAPARVIASNSHLPHGKGRPLNPLDRLFSRSDGWRSIAIVKIWLNTLPGRIWLKWLVAILLLPLLLRSPIAGAQSCPALQAYYPTGTVDWPALVAQLEPLQPRCLENAEYFALLGAALLNATNIPAALEALERALLLDPDNGAAQVDYAEALFRAGQLFPALELNSTLLQRPDIPGNLQVLLQQRQQNWQGQTRRRGLQVELDAGYDNNLNGAPARSDFTLTLSGEQIVLTLDPEYRPVSGPYLNLRLAGFFQRLEPDRSQDLIFALRGRFSEHQESELLQFDWRYALTLSGRKRIWELVAGTSHLLYGGSPLYSVSEARIRNRGGDEGCGPKYELAAQHQLYHGQSVMTGLEASATSGFECRLAGGRQLFAVDTGPLGNFALKGGRPGDDRQGWKLRLSWQLQLAKGALDSQFSYANLDDTGPYSEILAGGARRQIGSRFFRVQYSQPLQQNLVFQLNLTHQDQTSNIAPFVNRGTAAEVGLMLNF